MLAFVTLASYLWYNVWQNETLCVIVAWLAPLVGRITKIIGNNNFLFILDQFIGFNLSWQPLNSFICFPQNITVYKQTNIHNFNNFNRSSPNVLDT